MGIFRKHSEPQGTRPTDAQVREAAAALRAGDQRPADRLADGSGDYSQETALRVLGHCID